MSMIWKVLLVVLAVAVVYSTYSAIRLRHVAPKSDSKTVIYE